MTPRPSGRTVSIAATPRTYKANTVRRTNTPYTATTRKAVSTIRHNFNPRIILRGQNVYDAFARQGIDVGDLADFQKAREILQIPNVSVRQADSAEPFLKELDETVIRETNMGLNTHPAFCSGITPEYIRKSLKKSDMVVYIKNRQIPYDILGFATLNIVDGDLYVDVICTNQAYVGMGRHMLEKILLRLKDVLGLRYITLCSTRSAHPWYVHMGFEEIENDKECPKPMKKMRLQRKTAKRPRTTRTFM